VPGSPARKQQTQIREREIMISKNTWNMYCTRFLVRARQLTEPIAFIDPLGHEHVGRPGDYLVETSNGIRRIAAKHFFEDTYVPITPVPHGSQEGTLHERRAPNIAARNSSLPGHEQGHGEDRPRAMA
jgi:hypothetical protein